MCEVYRIDASTLAELDALRTKGGEYKRYLTQTPFGSAWLYVYQRALIDIKPCTAKRRLSQITFVLSPFGAKRIQLRKG